MAADNQKTIGLLALAFIGLATLFFGIKTIPGRLIKPFNLLPAGSSGVKLTGDTDAAEQARILALKNQDTDRDSLNDYDEIAIYKTSPYIADSDSDDLSDYDEIKNGTDPNCPEGQDCRLAIGNISAADAATPTGLEQNLLGSLGAVNGAVPGLGASELNVNLSPDELRSLLKENGFSETELKNIDDATLTKLWQDSLKQNVAANGNGSTGTNAQALPAKTPTASELRQMLKNAGTDPVLLEKVSDAELLKMYSDIVTSSQ